MKIRITLEATVREQDYPLLSQASSKAEIITALKEEHIIDDVIIPNLEGGGPEIIAADLVKE